MLVSNLKPKNAYHVRLEWSWKRQTGLDWTFYLNILYFRNIRMHLFFQLRLGLYDTADILGSVGIKLFPLMQYKETHDRTTDIVCCFI